MPLSKGKSRKTISVSDGWREEAVNARKQRSKDEAAMVQFAGLVESWVEGKLPLPTLLLAFHHVAMAHGAYAGKKTLRQALKSSIEEVSAIAPCIFPPDRLIKPRRRNRPPSGVPSRGAAELRDALL